MSSENQDWEVKELDDLNTADLQLVSEFFNTHFPGVFYPQCTPEIFNWKLGPSNPAGRGFITAAINKGQVIGVFTLTRKNVIKNGMKLEVGEIGDAYTHPQFRKGGNCVSPKEHLGLNDNYFEKSIFGRLVAETLFRAKLNGIKFVYGTPNSIARPSYIKRLGFLECSGDRIFSKYLLTKYFKRPRLFSPILNIASRINYLSCKTLIRLHFGKNAITRVQGEEVLRNTFTTTELGSYQRSDLEMLIDKEYILNRYITHPSLHYLYFKVTSKKGLLGYIIATEIVRASGIKTLVISDWIIFEPAFVKMFNPILGSLRSFARDTQTISLWQSNKTPWINFFISGIFSVKPISIVGKSLDEEIPTKDFTFSDFHFGWSDNG